VGGRVGKRWTLHQTSAAWHESLLFATIYVKFALFASLNNKPSHNTSTELIKKNVLSSKRLLAVIAVEK